MKNVILAPTDFSEPARAGVLAAVELAATLDGSVVLVHVVDAAALSPLAPLDWAVDPEVAKGLHAKSAKQLSSIASELGGQVEIRTVVLERPSVAHALADYAEEIDARMVAMCTHGRTGIVRLLLGSVTEKTVRLARCPVLTVPAP